MPITLSDFTIETNYVPLVVAASTFIPANGQCESANAQVQALHDPFPQRRRKLPEQTPLSPTCIIFIDDVDA